jgi:hypothetical protein
MGTVDEIGRSSRASITIAVRRTQDEVFGMMPARIEGCPGDSIVAGDHKEAARNSYKNHD